MYLSSEIKGHSKLSLFSYTFLLQQCLDNYFTQLMLKMNVNDIVVSILIVDSTIMTQHITQWVGTNRLTESVSRSVSDYLVYDEM